MKKFLLVILVCVFCNVGMVTAECELEDEERIGNCYEKSIFSSTTFPLRDNFLSIFYNISDIRELCQAKVELDQCIAPINSSATLRNDCMNNETLAFYVYWRKHRYAIHFGELAMINYLQLDYLCGSGAISKVIQEQHLCMAFQGYEKCGKFDNRTCETARDDANCYTNIITERCGPAAGCVAKKFIKLHGCYAETKCEECEELTLDNNLINGLCDEDVLNGQSSFVISSILTVAILLLY